MFTIDLLKGQGIPARSKPERIAAVVITIIIPVIAAAVMLGSFYVNKVNISFIKGNIAKMQKDLSAGPLSDVLKQQKLLEQQKKDLSESLSEVSSAIGSQIQWSPLLEAIIRKMPPSVVLRAADVKKDSKKITRPNPNEKDKTIETTVPVRILHLSLTTEQQSNFDQVVKGYRESLLSRPCSCPKLDDIRVAQEFDKVEG